MSPAFLPTKATFLSFVFFFQLLSYKSKVLQRFSSPVIFPLKTKRNYSYASRSSIAWSWHPRHLDTKTKRLSSMAFLLLHWGPTAFLLALIEPVVNPGQAVRSFFAISCHNVYLLSTKIQHSRGKWSKRGKSSLSSYIHGVSSAGEMFLPLASRVAEPKNLPLLSGIWTFTSHFQFLIFASISTLEGGAGNSLCNTNQTQMSAPVLQHLQDKSHCLHGRSVILSPPPRSPLASLHVYYYFCSGDFTVVACTSQALSKWASSINPTEKLLPFRLS